MEEIMATDKIDIERCNEEGCYMTTDDVAALLVELYGKYREETCNSFGDEEKKRSQMYAKAIGIAIRMLTD
jgi:hypothetical protein